MLYFSANDGVIGRELWRLSSSGGVSVSLSPISEILVFPNPASQYLTIRKTNLNTPIQTRLLDSQGREVIPNTVLTSETVEMDIHTLTNGLYLLEVTETNTSKRYCKKVYIVR